MECWYMIYKNLLYTGMLFVVLPVWFGLLWVWYLKIEGTVRKLCNAWVLGLASMFASGQILLVPMILGKRTLTEAVTLWKIFLVIVSIVIMVILIRSKTAPPCCKAPTMRLFSESTTSSLARKLQEIGKFFTCPNCVSQLLKNIMADADVPRFPTSPASL